MTDETNPLTPLSNYDIEGEGFNITEPSDTTEPFVNLSNKRSKNQTSGNTIKKIKTLDKTDKHKSWVWQWCDPILLSNGKIGAECSVKITDEKVCGRCYLSGNSTSNLISHLVGLHQITENTKVEGRLVRSLFSFIK
jgi:hypothetical protein